MTNILKNIRLEGRNSDFLSRIRSDPGTIYFNRDTKTLVVFDGDTSGGVELLKADLSNVDKQLGVIFSDTPPTGVDPGTIWYKTNNGKLYVLYNDGDSEQWIQPKI